MQRSFLGRGWKFPVDIDRRKGIAVSEYEHNIRESIIIILGTAPGERVMRPDFGCGIHELMFAPNNANTHGMIIYYVEEALRKWEPRIQNLNVSVDYRPEEEAKVLVKLEYQVIATNNVFNLVYPFYLQRGEAV